MFLKMGRLGLESFVTVAATRVVDDTWVNLYAFEQYTSIKGIKDVRVLLEVIEGLWHLGLKGYTIGDLHICDAFVIAQTVKVLFYKAVTIEEYEQKLKLIPAGKTKQNGRISVQLMFDFERKCQ